MPADPKQRALAALATARERRDSQVARARATFRAAVVRAREAGASLEEIGKALGGISHVAVKKIIERGD